MKQSIHLILYLVEYCNRTFLDYEKPLLSQLVDLNVKMLFLVTKSPFKKDDEQFEEFHDILTEDIEEMFNGVKKEITNKLFGENFCDLGKIVFPVNSKKERKNDEEFGLDILFDKCYEIFKSEIIPYDIVSELEKGEEKHIAEILKKYMLFKVYKSRKDIISHAKKMGMKTIIKYCFYSSIGSYLPSFGNSLNCVKFICEMTTSLVKVYGKYLTKDEAKALVEYELKKKRNFIKKFKN